MIWELIEEPTVTVDTRQGLLTVSTHDNEIGRCLYCQKECQRYTAQQAVSFLRAEGLLPPIGTGTIVDIGAHIGHISIGMLLDGEFEKAVGIEPLPENFELLKQNVKQNGLEDRYTLYNYAISNQDTDELLEICDANTGDCRIQRTSLEPERNCESRRETIHVKGQTLDSVTLPDDVALIWIDVQGFEGRVFQGGRKLFSKPIPVNVEMWPYGILRSGMELDEFIDIVSSIWSTFCINRDGYTKYPVDCLDEFLSELDTDNRGLFEDVILLKDV